MEEQGHAGGTAALPAVPLPPGPSDNSISCLIRQRAFTEAIQFASQGGRELLNRTEGNGDLPLHVAVKQQAPPEVIHALVQGWGQALHEKDGKGRLAFHIAAASSSVKVLELLYHAWPAALLEVSTTGELAAGIARKHENSEAVDWLENRVRALVDGDDGPAPRSLALAASIAAEPEPTDVVCGRGGHNGRVGNRVFRAVVTCYGSCYGNCTDMEKKKIVLRLFGFFRRRGTRFLEKSNGGWRETEEDKVAEKIKQLLRDKKPADRESLGPSPDEAVPGVDPAKVKEAGPPPTRKGAYLAPSCNLAVPAVAPSMNDGAVSLERRDGSSTASSTVGAVSDVGTAVAGGADAPGTTDGGPRGARPSAHAQYSDFDYLLGNLGGRAINHPGNQTFRKEALRRLAVYLASDNNGKEAIIKDLIKRWKDREWRFLKEDKKRWVDATEKEVKLVYQKLFSRYRDSEQATESLDPLQGQGVELAFDAMRVSNASAPDGKHGLQAAKEHPDALSEACPVAWRSALGSIFKSSDSCSSGASRGGAAPSAAAGRATIARLESLKSKPMIRIPPPGIGPVCSPNNNDVLCGRGGRITAHSGNVNFRELVQSRKADYLSEKTKKLEKAHIASAIVRQIREMNPPGRFLKEGPDGSWYDIGDAKAIKKVGQALRENAPDIRGDIHAGSDDDESAAGGGAQAPIMTVVPLPPTSAPSMVLAPGTTISARGGKMSAAPVVPLQHPGGPSRSGGGGGGDDPYGASPMGVPASAGGGKFSVTAAAAVQDSEYTPATRDRDIAFGRQFHMALPEMGSGISGLSYVPGTMNSGMSGVSALTDPSLLGGGQADSSRISQLNQVRQQWAAQHHGNSLQAGDNSLWVSYIPFTMISGMSGVSTLTDPSLLGGGQANRGTSFQAPGAFDNRGTPPHRRSHSSPSFQDLASVNDAMSWVEHSLVDGGIADEDASMNMSKGAASTAGPFSDTLLAGGSSSGGGASAAAGGVGMSIPSAGDDSFSVSLNSFLSETMRALDSADACSTG